jgi:hypothetical protein
LLNVALWEERASKQWCDLAGENGLGWWLVMVGEHGLVGENGEEWLEWCLNGFIDIVCECLWGLMEFGASWHEKSPAKSRKLVVPVWSGVPSRLSPAPVASTPIFVNKTW